MRNRDCQARTCASHIDMLDDSELDSMRTGAFSGPSMRTLNGSPAMSMIVMISRSSSLDPAHLAQVAPAAQGGRGADSRVRPCAAGLAVGAFLRRLEPIERTRPHSGGADEGGNPWP